MPISLSSPISEQFRMTPLQKTALAKLGIKTVEDMLYHFPVRYGDTAEARSVDSLRRGDAVVVYGKIGGLKVGKGFKSHITMATGYVEDETGSVQCVWFNQPYVAKMYTDGMLVRIEGKVSERRTKKPESESGPAPLAGQLPVTAEPIAEPVVEAIASGPLYFSNPKIEKVEKLPTGVGDSLFGNNAEAHTLYPVYPESRGITSSWLYHNLQKLFKSGILDTVTESIPADILEKYHLPGLKTALIWMHAPLNREDALSARKRFSFEEIFTIQLGKQQARKEYREHPAFAVETDQKHVDEFIRRFPFTATGAQIRAIEAILTDMRGDFAMSRLLEGDVGSGKTAVAAATSYAVMTSHHAAKRKKEEAESEAASGGPTSRSDLRMHSPLPLQIAYMCPTEILAIQHFESFIQFFSYMPIQIGLITGSGCRKFPSKVNPKGWTDISRAQLLKWVANGEIAVLIGTHALIQKSVQFRNLAYVIIDEQHRFGTAQRAKLVRKEGAAAAQGKSSGGPTPRSDLRNSPAPHLLSMTATPIPRTLALTVYGDLDLTLLDEIPAGRKPIITELVLKTDRDATYEKIRQELQAGRQAYVICPRIDEPDPDMEAALNAKSVKEESKRLQKSVFPEFKVGMIHGKMSPKDKDSAMMDFKEKKTHILCATSVIEVGVNVPNATVIIIEGAERFGLSQLHQLRGRVMRSSDQAYCYVFTETSSKKSIDRLTALKTAKNGFELAELDLAQRGAGELSGARQWGVSDVAMEALQNLKMVEAARTEAARLVAEDSTLSKYPALKRAVEAHKKVAHFE